MCQKPVMQKSISGQPTLAGVSKESGTRTPELPQSTAKLVRTRAMQDGAAMQATWKRSEGWESINQFFLEVIVLLRIGALVHYNSSGRRVNACCLGSNRGRHHRRGG